MSLHTDKRGFANPTSSGPYDAILVGDSFGIGAEQDEGERLASQISLRIGLSVYNACSPVKTISREDLMTLIEQLGITRGTVFFELMDWSLGFYSSAQQEPGFTGFEHWSKNFQYSPLANISRGFIGRLYDGRLMPNPYSTNVVRKNLPDGQPILFQLDDVRNGTPDGPKLWARYFRVLNEELRMRNIELIVILVPSKYTVYQPLIGDAPATNKGAQFEELEKELSSIPVINTTPALQQAAASALTQGRLLYWRDDTHWNGEGVRVAAEKIAQLYGKDRSVQRTRSLKPVSQQQIP